jgi:pimeloyl-ACP methyl ester carboxylesterase
MSVTTTTGWEALGAYRRLAGHQVFTIDAPPLGPEEHEPVLALHGFPTSSFDYAAVLDRLRANRRVVLLDFLGFGLSDKPDLHYTLALQADLVVALVDELELDRVALLTHDMGDLAGRGHPAGAGQRQHLHRPGPSHRRTAVPPGPPR